MATSYNEQYYQANKEKLKKRARDYARLNPDKVRANWLRRRYGITPEQYDSMLAAQGGHCAICPATEPGRGNKFFHVDHAHNTSRVRGLLCTRCNTALGLLKDSPVLAEAAAIYLRAAQQEVVHA